jgi:hypothetical protein
MSATETGEPGASPLRSTAATPAPLPSEPRRERGLELRPLRIRRLSYKIVFVVASLVLLEVLGGALTAFDPFGPGASASLAIEYGWWVLVFRCFRGADEPSAPRPWWKATARPATSAGLAVLLVFAAMIQVVYLASVLPSGWMPPASAVAYALGTVTLVVYLMISFSLQRRALRDARTS